MKRSRRESRDSSECRSETQEEATDKLVDDKIYTGRKLGANFFVNTIASKSNSNYCPNNSTSTSNASAGHKSWGKSRSSAALWPIFPDLEESDTNNNSAKNETQENLVNSQSQFSDELVIVTEQLQIIQETQDSILSQIKNEFESLQTENLCLQRNNSKLRIQVDNLNGLLIEMARELELMRKFVQARNDHNENNPVVTTHGRHSDNSTEKNTSRKKGKNKKLKDVKNKEIKRSSSEKLKSRKKKSSSSNDELPEDESAKVKSGPFGFITKIFRTKTSRPKTSGSRSSSSLITE